MVIFRQELRILRRDPLPVLSLVLMPLVLMAFVRPERAFVLVGQGHPGANGAEEAVPGMTVLFAFFLVSFVPFAFFREHGWGTWERLRATPASSVDIVVGKSLPRVGVGIVELVVIMVAGVVLFDLDVRGQPAALLPLIVAFSVCLVLLGVAATALSRTAQQASAFAFTGMVLFGAIGGAFVPFSVLPGWAQTIAPVTPTYWAMRGMRSVVLDGRGLGGVLAPTAMLLAMSALFAVVALVRFRFEDAKTGFV
jgi:ABC-2 type transport system permease protein